jgi:hypothetical protein
MVATGSQPALLPVACGRCLEQRQPGQPLDTLHAVAARDEQPRGVAVLLGQFGAVHAERHQHVLAGQGRQRVALAVAVGGHRLDRGCGGGWPGLAQQVGQGHAGPAGVADQRPADRVGDAAHGHQPFDRGHGAQVGEGQAQRPGDRAVHPQRPAARRHGRVGQVDVDHVVVGGRRDCRRQPGDPRKAGVVGDHGGPVGYDQPGLGRLEHAARGCAAERGRAGGEGDPGEQAPPAGVHGPAGALSAGPRGHGQGGKDRGQRGHGARGQGPGRPRPAGVQPGRTKAGHQGDSAQHAWGGAAQSEPKRQRPGHAHGGDHVQGLVAEQVDRRGGQPSRRLAHQPLAQRERSERRLRHGQVQQPLRGQRGHRRHQPAHPPPQRLHLSSGRAAARRPSRRCGGTCRSTAAPCRRP